MKLDEVVQKLKIKVLSGETFLDKNVSGGYTSDLLSDVMGNAREGNLWVTVQVHKNIVAVATLKDLSAIILVRNQKPGIETLEAAEKENIPILSTSMGAFQCSGEIYKLLETDEIL